MIKKIYKKSIWYFLISLLFFQPARYVLGDSLTSVWNYVLIAVCAVYVFLYIKNIRSAGMRKPDVGILALTAAHVFCLCISSLFNVSTSNIRGGVIYAAFLAGFIAYSRFGLINAPKQFLEGMIAAGTLICGANLLTILLYQNNGGMRKGIDSAMGRAYSDNWFLLGHANNTFFVVFPVVVLLFVYAYQFHKKWIKPAYLFAVFALASFCVQWSLAGFLSFSVFLGLVVLDGIPSPGAVRIVKRAVDLRLNMIVFLTLESFLALFSGLSRYTDFLLKYFGKGQSISARLGIWTNAVRYIMMRPILGNGWNKESVEIMRLTRSHTHNILIEYLYCGGIVAVFLFLFAVEYLQRQIDTRKSLFYSNKASRIALYAVTPYMLACTFDYYMFRYHPMILYVILWYLYYHSGKAGQNENGLRHGGGYEQTDRNTDFSQSI